MYIKMVWPFLIYIIWEAIKTLLIFSLIKSHVNVERPPTLPTTLPTRLPTSLPTTSSTTRVATLPKRSNFDRPQNCDEIQLGGNTKSGVYKIYLKDNLDNNETFVFCDMETDGGGWTLFQRRTDTEIQEDFYRGWNDYARGFGSLSESFWLGLDNIREMVKRGDKTLRIDMEDFKGQKRYAEYKIFIINGAADKYRLYVNGYSGNAGDSFSYQVYREFTTKDQDNDLHTGNCAESFRGAWWYVACHASNLNGKYLRGNHSSYADGVNWMSWKGHHYSLKKTEMKIRQARTSSC